MIVYPNLKHFILITRTPFLSVAACGTLIHKGCGDGVYFGSVDIYHALFMHSQQVDRMLGKNERLRSDMFGELLQAANNTGDLRSCPVCHMLLLFIF